MSEVTTEPAVEELIGLASAVEAALSAKESPNLLVGQVTNLETMVVERNMSRRVIEAVRALLV